MLVSESTTLLSSEDTPDIILRRSSGLEVTTETFKTSEANAFGFTVTVILTEDTLYSTTATIIEVKLGGSTKREPDGLDNQWLITLSS